MTPVSPAIAQHRPKSMFLVFAIFACLGLLFVACGIISLCVAFSSDTPLRGRLIMIAMAALALFLPAWFAFAALRLRWTTGQWTLSPEERQARLSRIANQKPSRMLRLASSSTFRNVLNSGIAALAAINIWQQVREGIHAFQLTLVVVWSAVAAASLWQLLHKPRSAPESKELL